MAAFGDECEYNYNPHDNEYGECNHERNIDVECSEGSCPIIDTMKPEVEVGANVKTDKNNGSTTSYIVLFLLTGVIGAFFAAGVGYAITKILKLSYPTTFDQYGWRGVGIACILFTLMLFLEAIRVVLFEDEEIGEVLFIVVPVVFFGYIGKKCIYD